MREIRHLEAVGGRQGSGGMGTGYLKAMDMEDTGMGLVRKIRVYGEDFLVYFCLAGEKGCI